MTRGILTKHDDNTMIAELKIARAPHERIVGLLGSPNLPPREGLWLDRCWAVHTLGMRYSIDIIFLDAQNRVIRTEERVAPNRFMVACPNARVTIELGAGTLERVSLLQGDRLQLIRSAGIP